MNSLLAVEADEDDIVTLEPMDVRTVPVEGTPVSLYEPLVFDDSVNPFDGANLFEGTVPNFFAADTGTRSFGDIISVRGLANTLFFSNPAVAFYIDDVPVGAAFAAARNLADLRVSRFEAGPQGTRLGRNSQAGLIEVETFGPTDIWFTEARASYATFDQRRFSGLLSGPLGGVPFRGEAQSPFAFSLFGFWEDRDGFVLNSTLGDETDTREAYGGRLKLEYAPSADFDITVSLEVDRIRDGSQQLVPLANGPGSFLVASDLEGQTNIDRDLQSIRLRREFGLVQFKSITARQFWELDPSTVDLDFTAAPILTSEIRQQRRQWTQEFRFESLGDPDSAQWRAGLFGLYADNDNESVREIGLPAPEETTYSIEEYSLAAFGNLTLPWTEHARLTLGARGEVFHSEIDRAQTTFFGSTAFTDEATFLNGALDAGIEVDAHRTLTLFGKVALAYKPGGFSGFASEALAEFDSERSFHAEAGFNFEESFQTVGDVQASFTVFFIRSSDYQFERSVPLSTDFIVVNAASAISHGVEATFGWQPVERLSFLASAGYNDARFDNFSDPFTGASLDDNRLPFTPRYTVRLAGEVKLLKGLTVSGGVTALGETYFDEVNTTAFRQSEYAIVDLAVRYERDRFGVSVFARNLLDRAYFTSISPNISVVPPFGAGSVGEPQVFGVSGWVSY
ncbi:MAG: TonB-dependent receptor [Opitutales bacterium]